jgi:hypothetical protein
MSNRYEVALVPIMATTPGETKKDGKAFYGYLFTKAKPIPAPTPAFDALLRAIALHIVRRTAGNSKIPPLGHVLTQVLRPPNSATKVTLT